MRSRSRIHLTYFPSTEEAGARDAADSAAGDAAYRGTLVRTLPRPAERSGWVWESPDEIIAAWSPPPEPFRERLVAGPWGWLPLLSLTSGLGLLVFALANNASRAAEQWADPLFWSGLVIIFLPIAARLIFGTRLTRQERLGLLVLAGLALYGAKYLEAPLTFGLYDEYLHWRTAQDIALTHHLFATNPLLPISATFPGLEIATNALSSLTGLSLFTSGLLIVGVARIILVIALYLFLSLVLGSERLAGMAALVYFANPHMLYFDAAFSYESLALPLAFLVLWAIVRHTQAQSGERLGLIVASCLGLGAVAITHHVTSYVLVGFLFVWALLTIILRRTRRADASSNPVSAVRWLAPVGLAVCVGLFLYANTTITHYLGPDVSGAINQITGLVSGTSAPRQLFHDYSGGQTAQWERIAAMGSVLLILAVLPFGWFRIVRLRMMNPLMLLLVMESLLYVALLPLRLSQEVAEFGDRATAFLFVGLAVVVAIGAERLLMAWNTTRILAAGRAALLSGWIAVAFVGGIVAGAGPIWNRMPGPYMVGADPRSITPEGIDAAIWARTYLGSGNRFATDRVNSLLLETYGEQTPLVYFTRTLQVADLFTSTQIDPGYRSILASGWLQYIEVDQRLSTGLPKFGYYFNAGEPQAMRYTQPIPLSALQKFDGAPGINRLFDSGYIAIYSAGVLPNG